MVVMTWEQQMWTWEVDEAECLALPLLDIVLVKEPLVITEYFSVPSVHCSLVDNSGVMRPVMDEWLVMTVFAGLNIWHL